MKKAMSVLLAAAAGVAAGVLMAPKSGKETREDLKKKADEAKTRADEKATQVRGAVKEGYGSLRTTASDVKEEAVGFADRAKMSAKDLAEEAKARGHRIGKKTERTADDLHKDVDSTMKK